jgi:hypothetical protein
MDGGERCQSKTAALERPKPLFPLPANEMLMDPVADETLWSL